MKQRLVEVNGSKIIDLNKIEFTDEAGVANHRIYFAGASVLVSNEQFIEIKEKLMKPVFHPYKLSVFLLLCLPIGYILLTENKVSNFLISLLV